MGVPPDYEPEAPGDITMRRRSGATLIEVLVAVFVTAIGLLALLALFPLGALNMAQAIKDSRAAQATANAAAIAEIQQIRNDPGLYQPWDAFAWRETPSATPIWPVLSNIPNYDGPSYPVYIDPIGVSIPDPSTANFLGAEATLPSPGIVRRTASFVATPPTTPKILRWFTLLDDLTFATDGQPAMPGGVAQREGRYSWAYMVRRPKFSAPSVAEVSVVVYSGRSPVVSGETPYVVDFVHGQNTVTVTPGPGQQKPALRNGMWILDATVIRKDPQTGAISPDPYGFFYRVVNVTDDPSSNTIALELQTPIKSNVTVTPTPPSYLKHTGVLVVLDNVVEVFEKGAGWLP
jgi:hypothetical protein